jgi:hypothetical protein
MTKYAEIEDPKLQGRIRTRYASDIADLQTLGFRHLAFKLEARAPFSAFAYLPILPLMRRAKEVLVFPFPLRIATANVLLINAQPSTIAQCLGLGVKFYTNFSDGHLVISSTLLSHAALQAPGIQKPGLQIFRTPPCGTVAEAWLSHRCQVSEMEASGKTISNTNSFADYVVISEREEEDLRYAQRQLP